MIGPADFGSRALPVPRRTNEDLAAYLRLEWRVASVAPIVSAARAASRSHRGPSLVARAGAALARLVRREDHAPVSTAAALAMPRRGQPCDACPSTEDRAEVMVPSAR